MWWVRLLACMVRLQCPIVDRGLSIGEGGSEGVVFALRTIMMGVG